jgi:hypothetical protein
MRRRRRNVMKDTRFIIIKWWKEHVNSLKVPR